jgi:hypothetical protein
MHACIMYFVLFTNLYGAFGGNTNVHDVIYGKKTFQLMWNTNGIIVTIFSDSFLIKFQWGVYTSFLRKILGHCPVPTHCST